MTTTYSFIYTHIYPHTYANCPIQTVSSSTAFKDVSNLQVKSKTANGGANNRPSKYDTEKVSNPKKKHVVQSFADDGDTETHKKVILSLADVKLRRQQMKVVNAMKEHHNSMKSLTNLSGKRVQTLITDYMKPKSEMRYRTIDDLEAAQLLVKPDPFLAEGQLNPNEYHLGHILESYQHFIDKEQEIANKDIQHELYVSQKKPLLHMPNLAKCGWMHCSGCGNMIINCHDVVFGAFCVHEVINFCAEAADYGITETEVKKVFLDTYNKCLVFVLFKAKENKVHKKWIFPPLCVQDNSYSYALFWYEWIVLDLWCFGDDDKAEDGSESADSDDKENEE